MLTHDIEITVSSCVGMKLSIQCENAKLYYMYYTYRAKALSPISRDDYIEDVAKSATWSILKKQTEISVTVLPSSIYETIKNVIYNMVRAMHVVDDIAELKAIVSLSIWEDYVIEDDN